MKIIRTICQYFVLLLCVAACGLMAVCLGIGELFSRTAGLFKVGWDECKKMTALLLVLGAVSASAAGSSTAAIGLKWDASPSHTNVANYRVYAATNSAVATNLSVALTNINAGTNLSCIVSNMPLGTTWFFVATARDKFGVESKPSNMAAFTFLNAAPEPPGTLMGVYLEASTDLIGWTDKSFFRARIVPLTNSP